MTNEEKLKKARNLIRYLFRKMGNELDIRFRENSGFFFDLMRRCAEIGVIDESDGTFRLTEKEHTEGHQKGARHRGCHPRQKHTLL